MTGTITPTDLTVIVDTLASLRAAGRDIATDDLANGDFVVAAMSPSGKVKIESATRWHLVGDAGDLWGIAYKVANAASAYQANGAVCGFARGYDDASATVKKLVGATANGRQQIVKGSVLAVPAYVVRRDQLAALTAVLAAAYDAWVNPPVADAATPAPAKRTRKAKAS